MSTRILLLFATLLLSPAALWAGVPAGYYRFPAIHRDTVVFTAEGDLWKVGVDGGGARRLTTHPGQETHAAISPAGDQIAFSADYEGPTEVYVMPLAGGLPRRLTFDGDRATVAGWTPQGEVLYATRHFSTLPSARLVRLDPATGERRQVPLDQAAQGVFDAAGETLFFTRFRFQGSHTKRYRGGAAQGLWRFAGVADTAAPEATSLTGDYAGTSRDPMWWQERLYFTSDRDGTMNLWSMAGDGGDLRQHTRHVGWDVKSPDLSQGRVVYQLGADLRVLDLATGVDRELEVTLASDFDQLREKWVKKPMEYLTAAHLSPAGDRVVLTARGQVFVAPVRQGRWTAPGSADGVRFRAARFLPPVPGTAGGAPAGESPAAPGKLVALSDESGEVELWRLDARGVEAREQLTRDGEVLRFDTLPSPDGRRVAYVDHDQRLSILDLKSGEQTEVATSPYFEFQGLAWSGDGRWLAYSAPGENLLARLVLYDAEGGTATAVTSDRFDSTSPAFHPGGEWLYFLSDRNLVSVTRDPWGSYQPGPFLDRKTKIYHLSLKRGLRSPFAPRTELMAVEEKEETAEGGKKDGEAARPPATVEIDFDGLDRRLEEVRVEPGNYSQLAVTASHLLWLSAATSIEPQRTLQALEIGRDKPQVKSLVSGIETFELTPDGRKILIRRKEHLYVVEVGKLLAAEGEKGIGELLEKHELSLDGWTFVLDPREEWRQMFRDAWRLLRDYFYDPDMHGVDWPAMLQKYLPLVDRVTDRAELNDLFGELSGELAALHHFVRGGDQRQGPDQIEPASLGAVLERDEAAGGFRVVEVWATDPDLPEERSPLARPGVEVGPGDVIVAINGTAALSAADAGVLLRHRAGEQVLLAVKDGETGELREAIVEPITPEADAKLRYDAWEYERRQRVEALGEGEIGYVHLRALGGGNYSEWARHYFPVFNRQGLIIDLRHNRGGNIDSWILGSLLRRPWMWWKPRTGLVYSNMQFAFGGHMVVLVDQFTASDGEAFAEGFRRLGLGEVIGERTWGGEIWLTSSNLLVDRGIATAAEFGVYGPEGMWLIEGHGVDPDLVVDNLPHATFEGADAQLEAAVEYLRRRIREDPPAVPEAPPYPDKSFRPGEDD